MDTDTMITRTWQTATKRYAAYVPAKNGAYRLATISVWGRSAAIDYGNGAHEITRMAAAKILKNFGA